MDATGEVRRLWVGRARRGAISLFLIWHLGATLIWVIPTSPLRQAAFPWVFPYIVPLGMWQSWSMFAPDPVRDALTLEAEVVDSRGLRYGHTFPRVADEPWWRAVPKFRHSKFAANLSATDFDPGRRVTAAYVARQFALPAEAYPISVRLIYQVRTPPPPGGPPADPMAPTYPQHFATVLFASLEEVTQ